MSSVLEGVDVAISASVGVECYRVLGQETSEDGGRVARGSGAACRR